MHKTIRRSARIFSLILALTLLIGIVPANAAADIGAATLQKLDPSKIDLSNLHKLPTQGVKLGSPSIKKLEGTSELTEEELTYVEEYAEMLVDPVGVVDITGSDDEAKYVFVWLQDLPQALENAYRNHGMRNSNYERVREEGRRARNSIRSKHNREIVYEYSVVFSGFAIETTMSKLEEIAAMDGVFAITEVTYDSMDYIPDPEYVALGNGVARKLMDIGDLHTRGIDGRGVKVGVIDSGIDINHPDLRGALKGGYNFAPRGTKNIGGRSPDLSTPDGNHGTHVSGIIASQGIFSLGIAPGVDLYMAQVFTPDNTNSAATADTTAALEVFSGGTPGSAYTGVNLPKVDVINMSLGNNNNTAYSVDHVARNNVVIAGVMLVNSAGNNAYPEANITDRRNYTLGSGGVSLPISVAASQYGGNTIISYKPTVSGSDPFEVYIENGDASLVTLFHDGRFGSTEPRVVPFNYTSSSDVNFPYPGPTYTVQPLTYVEGKGYEIFYACPSNVPSPGGTTTSDMKTEELQALNNMVAGSLSGKILVVNRGQNFLDYKGQALRLGAAGLIIINRDETVIGNLNIGSETASADLVIFSAPASVKKIMYDAVQGGATAYLDPGLLNKLGRAKEPADFSSIGPVNETAEIKPDIIAPGYAVLSTDLGGGYVEMGGTSMSSPFIAAVAALVKCAFPNAQPAEIKARIMNTADPTIIKPLTGRPNGGPGLYFDKDGTELSVFEQGAGFVNPKRAVSSAAYITVASDKIPTGSTNKSTFEEAHMASFSFGSLAPNEEGQGPALSDALTATVHGGTVTGIRVTYNHDTRYSNKNLDNGVELLYKISEGGKTFDAWLKINEWACSDQKNGNLYEGYVYATVDGVEFVLPWATRIGAAPATDFLVYFDRPVQVVNGTAAANQAYSPYSAQNIIYFMLGSEDTADSVTIRTASSGSGANIRYTYYLDFWFVKWTGDTGALSHRLSITLATGQMRNDMVLSDFIDIGETYYFTWDGRANAYLSLLGIINYVSTSLSAVSAGAYSLALPMGDEYAFYNELGLVLTNARPTMTVNDRTLTANTSTLYEHLYAEDVTVNGRLYSAATKLASDYGFCWAGAYLYYYDLIFEVDQSLNVLVDVDRKAALEFYSEAYDELVPWFCDAEGYFSLTMPANTIGVFFPADICPSGKVYCADAFDISAPWTGTTFLSEPGLYGAMASFQWTPTTKSGPPTTSVKIDNSASVSVQRGMKYKFDVILNEGANRNNIEWKVINPLYASIVRNKDNSVTVTILNKTGTVILSAIDKIDGMSFSIILRIT